jgi:hypothetical protein
VWSVIAGIGVLVTIFAGLLTIIVNLQKLTQSSASSGPAPSASPPVSAQLSIQSDLQQDPNWADPAAIEELMRGAGLSSILPSDEHAAQQRIRNVEAQDTDGRQDWDYSPCVVAKTYDSLSGTQAMGDAAYPSIEMAGAQITQAVFVRHQPVIALVDSAQTYVVIVGVTLGPAGTAGPPSKVIVDDPWNIEKDGPDRNGGAALGQRRELTWDEFANHFSAVPGGFSGPWSADWVLIGTGLPLTC